MYDYIVVHVIIVDQESQVPNEEIFLLKDIIYQRDHGNDVILIVWLDYLFQMKVSSQQY